MNVLVVGAGIMGLCVSRSLAVRGARVHLVDSGPIPGDGSSSDAHRLIRFPYGHLRGYRRMVSDAYVEWNRLWELLGTTHYVESGSLIVGRSDSDWIRESIADMKSAGIPFNELSGAELLRLVPGLEKAREQRAVLVRRGGVLLADRVMQGLLELIESMDVDVSEYRRCEAAFPSGSAVFRDGRTELFDHIVLCTGPGETPAPGFRQSHATHQTAIYLQPPSKFWETCPSILDLTDPGGFYFVPPVEGFPAKMGSHTFGPSTHDLKGLVTQRDVRELGGIVGDRGAFAKDWEIVGLRSCNYDVTPDERFVIEEQGAIMRLSGFSGHGFKFGPLIGERLADMMLEGGSSTQYAIWLSGRI